MSGSGGGNGDWRDPTDKAVHSGAKQPTTGDGEGNAPANECNLIEMTLLNSPNRDVLVGLRSGDRLVVRFEQGPPQRLLAEDNRGNVAGSITGPKMTQIIQCIRAGHEYNAEVLSVHGSQCRVRISLT